MSDQDKREKVINGLECHVKGDCAECLYREGWHTCNPTPEIGLFADAIALLKAQEPRLMTLEEIQHTDAVWLETHGWVDGDVFETVLRCRSDFEDYVTEFATNDDCDITCVNSKIGIEWRCWTSRPTDEQREAIPWTT